MNQKKIVTYFLLISIVILSPLPLLNLYFIYNNNLDSNNITKKQLFTTDLTEGNINYFLYKNYNTSISHKKAVVGKDGYLFLGNAYSRVIDKTNGKFNYNDTDTDIDDWTTKLKKLQNIYEEQGIEFILVIAPNKHSIYSDKLPDNVKYAKGKTITDTTMKYALKKHIHMLNLKEDLLKVKNRYPLYFRTDTHWNNFGAAIGFEETMEFLNITYNKRYTVPIYRTKKISAMPGDLSKFLKIDKILGKYYEDNFQISTNQKNKICCGNIDDKHILKKCCKLDSNTEIDVNKGDKYTINKYALNKKKLLLICDSFAEKNSLLYNITFETIWRFHYNHLNGSDLDKFVNKNKPDIIIYQIVERDLVNDKIAK